MHKAVFRVSFFGSDRAQTRLRTGFAYKPPFAETSRDDQTRAEKGTQKKYARRIVIVVTVHRAWHTGSVSALLAVGGGDAQQPFGTRGCRLVVLADDEHGVIAGDCAEHIVQ